MMIERLCESVMRGVAASGVLKNAPEAELDRACELMKAEVRLFLFDISYADERAAILARSVSETTVVATIVLNVVEQILRLRNLGVVATGTSR